MSGETCIDGLVVALEGELAFVGVVIMVVVSCVPCRGKKSLKFRAWKYVSFSNASDLAKYQNNLWNAVPLA
jgi:hypothetical protein